MNDKVANNLLIKNCNLIDGVSESVLKNMDILISGGKIVKIEKDLHVSKIDLTLDLSGKTVLPGLIDVHVHLAFDASNDPVGHLTNDPEYITLIKMVMNCQKQIRSGVTTVRDMGAPRELILSLREAWKQNIISGPRMLVSGQVITTKGGHCHYIGNEVEGSESAREATEKEIRHGVDVIKIMASGGSLTPGSSVHVPQFCAEEIKAVVKKAHENGVKVAAHANALKGIQNAIEAGVDSIEHGSFADEKSIESMLDEGVFLVPTMAPAEVLLRSSLITEQRRNDVAKNWNSRKKAVKKAINIGLKMASGTDAGVTYMAHGMVALEISLFHQLGMDPMKAIWTATSWAAELLGISDQVGIVTTGKVADLIVVQGDPLKDLHLLASPELVLINGQIINQNVSLSSNISRSLV